MSADCEQVEMGETSEEVEMGETSEEIEMSETSNEVEISETSEEVEISETSSETSEEVEISETTSDWVPNDDQLIVQLKVGGSLSLSKVFNHFVEFGDIRMASFIPRYAFIMFEYVDSYEKVLAVHRIEIEGQSILAKRADCNNLPYEMYERVRKAVPMTNEVSQLLLIPENEASPNNIVLALNEYCVREILLRLPLLDLYSVAKTCRRFNGIAQAVFETKYKSKDIRIDELKRVDEAITMSRIEHFLINFGSSITSFHFRGEIEGGSHNDVVELLDKYCKNIKTLGLDEARLENFVIDNHVEMLGRVKKLLIRSGFLSVKRLLGACFQLEILLIYGDDLCDSDLKGVSLPHLTQLHLNMFNCYVSKFLKRHSRIEIFTFESPGPMNSDRHHYVTNDLIYNCLPNIRQVEIYTSNSDNEYRLLSRTKNLKSVDIVSCSQRPYTSIMNELLKQNTPIEDIQLCCGTIDNDTIESICKIKTIQTICFSNLDGVDTNKLIRLVEELPNLKEVTCSVAKSAEFIAEILPSLQNRGIKWSDQEYNDGGYASYDPKNDVVFINNQANY